MPLLVPTLPDRKYQDILDEIIARIPVHNPEWTNLNDSDPGVTLIQLFAFLTENLYYRTSLIPERNRRKFLSLLGIPLQAAAPAQGLITFTNDRGPMKTITLGSNVEVLAWQTPFRTESGLDILPVDWRVVYKRRIEKPSQELIDVYRELYVSFAVSGASPNFSLYETVPLDPTRRKGVNLAKETVDSSLWIAILSRSNEVDPEEVREEIANRTLSLGILPALDEEDLLQTLSPSAVAQQTPTNLLSFEIPAGGSLGVGVQRRATYRTIQAAFSGDPFTGPTIVQLTLPAKENLKLWTDVDPLESGVGDLPPSFEDTNLNNRLVTWIRIRLASGTQASSQAGGSASLSLLWAGLNTARVGQRTHVTDELLPPGTGAPDQQAALTSRPVISGSVKLTVSASRNGELARTETWQQIDDLLAAGSEVYVPSPRLPPGTCPPKPGPTKVFALDAESGILHFGDGFRGARPPFGAVLRADYDFSMGRSGNVGAGAINSGPTMPAGMKVTNPVPTWGGADSESVQEGEKAISRTLQHRDRLVTQDDFRDITRRTPGVDIGRVEVIPAYNPARPEAEPGDAPGVVTLMVIPRYSPIQPDAPMPDRLFLAAICNYLDPRRLVTTEVILRGPEYKGIWVSIGIRTVPGASIAVVSSAVKSAIAGFLSPLPPEDDTLLPGSAASATQHTGLTELAPQGWPLRTPVIALQLWAVASRVAGVLLVNDVQLSAETASLLHQGQVEVQGLELPRLLGISVTPGAPLSLDELRKQTNGELVTGTGGPDVFVPLPVPVIPEVCQPT